MLLVLLAFLLLLLRLFGFFFLRRLAVGSGLVSLRLELRHVGDQSRHLLYRPGDGLQESRVQFLRQSADRQGHDVVLGLVLQPVRLRQCGYRHLSVRFADDYREVHALGHHLVDCCKKHNCNNLKCE